jgi:amino acid adenylation domain-containing protein
MFNNLDLPTDKTRPAISTYNGGFARINLNTQVTKTLKQWCKQQGCTLFSALLAAYEIFLYRYTQQTDFCVGIPVANRHHSDTETIMGFFVNSLALRCDISSGVSFAGLTRKVQQRVLAAQNHQDIPFEKLVLSLPQIERNPGINPVFQTFFTLTQDNLEQGLQLHDIKAEYIPADIEGTKFDLSLNLREQGDCINCHFEYNRDLFTESTITAMLQHFINLLEQLCLLPELAIEKITFLTTEEYTLQMDMQHGWNATAFHYPAANALQELIQQQTEKTPDAVAVVDEHITLNYKELNQQANCLAHYLISLGITRNSPVAVCLERSVDMSIVLLAILKAGGCYVPLATDIPIERLRYICNETSASVLVTTQPVDLADNHHVVQLLAGNKHLWQDYPHENPPVINHSEDTFNIIYTSGSTGNPKGVMVPHQGIINRLRWMQHEYKLDTNDRIAQKTPYNFDVSVWELFWPLITGSSLYYAKPDGHKDPEYLRDFIQQHHISVLHFVPSMLGLFLQTPGIDSCHSVTRVFTSGEALQVQHNEAFFRQLPKAELHNLYGPTEASIDVSYYACRPNDSHKSIPIGKPIHNTQLHILDRQLQPMPIGAAGELHIGGIGLASGYCNQPELTQKAFIENPWFAKGHPSQRLYKTGDVARYLPNGDIEYLGRNDHQVKIRGFRIELGEIETQLRKLPGINDAVVINREYNGNTWLIAYLVSTQPLLDNAEYASLLKPHLPDYMFPTAYCAITRIPLSPNGKIDRKQLPDMNPADLQQTIYVAPRNAIETTLADMWQNLLGIEKAGIHDNFFELGGHSLLAAQMLTRIRDTFHIELPLRTLFEVNTIEGLAKIISAMSFAADVANDSLNDDEFEEGIL